MKVYLSSSWKNRERVRSMALVLTEDGHEVYDFTNPDCRNTPEIPPEAFPDKFDPEKHVYSDYIRAVPEWKAAVECNKEALEWCEVVILMLPCGLDSHADAFYALGLGKVLLVCGQPRKGERTPTHLWGIILDTDNDARAFLKHGYIKVHRMLESWSRK